MRAYVEHDPGDACAAEPDGFGFERVAAGGQRGKAVMALRIRDHGANDAGILVGQREFCARYRRAAGIGDDTGKFRVTHLRTRYGRQR